MVATSRAEGETFRLSSFLLSDGPAGFLLSWVAGFVDTSAFIILFGIFTAHVTGNIALAGSSFVASDEGSTVTRLLMLPTFMLTVAVTSLVARFARGKKWPVFAVLLTMEAIALAVFLAVATSLSPSLLVDVQEDLILPIAMAGVVAMAIQNALMKEAKGVFKSYIPTTVMTGNTTQLTIDLVQYVVGKLTMHKNPQASQEIAESVDRMGRVFPVILGFALGGASAVYFVMVSETWWSLIIPLIVISVMAIAAFKEHAQASSPA